jgi:hypothetical protein
MWSRFRRAREHASGVSINMPVEKNKIWISALHGATDRLDENAKSAMMKRAGEQCAKDLMALCEKRLGVKMGSVNDLVTGRNELHPVQCFCSHGMMETVFSQICKSPVEVEIKRSNGRDDHGCEFLIRT